MNFKGLIVTIIRSSIIGVFVGILPGAGGDIGSWVGYNEAKRFSKNSKNFGTGCLEGVAAPEAANNAVTGGALIPLLTLGIPGSAVTAILLGGLMIQGLVPGRELFTEHATITYSVIFGFFFANILMGVLGLSFAKFLIKVRNVPSGMLSCFIVILSVLGSYAININIIDVYVMVFFGILGYLLRKLDFHPAPIVLAVILGPLAEEGFRQSLVLSKGNLISYILGRPLCIVLLILIILSLFSPLLMKKMGKHEMENVE